MTQPDSAAGAFNKAAAVFSSRKERDWEKLAEMMAGKSGNGRHVGLKKHEDVPAPDDEAKRDLARMQEIFAKKMEQERRKTRGPGKDLRDKEEEGRERDFRERLEEFLRYQKKQQAAPAAQPARKPVQAGGAGGIALERDIAVRRPFRIRKPGA